MFRIRARRRLSIPLVLCLAAAPLVAGGCSGNADLVETQVPADGVELRYDLVAGATYDGTVRRSEVINTRGQQINRSLQFTVQMIVRSVDEDGSALVAATVRNIDVNWVVPGMPVSLDINERSKAQLEGATIRFRVRPSGEVFDVPAPPPELDEAGRQILQSVLDGLTSGFFVVPEDKLTAGKTWEDENSKGREGKLGKYTEEVVRGRLDGMYRHKQTNAELAKLAIERDRTETTTTQDGSTETRTRETTKVLFDVGADYLHEISSTMTRSRGPTVTTVNFKAEWTRSTSGGQVDAPKTVPQVQTIDDPCSDDYVGPEDCLDPCNVNYMGDQTCNEGEAPEDGETAGDGEATAGDGETSDEDDTDGGPPADVAPE